MDQKLFTEWGVEFTLSPRIRAFIRQEADGVTLSFLHNDKAKSRRIYHLEGDTLAEFIQTLQECQEWARNHDLEDVEVQKALISWNGG